MKQNKHETDAVLVIFGSNRNFFVFVLWTTYLYLKNKEKSHFTRATVAVKCLMFWQYYCDENVTDIDSKEKVVQLTNCLGQNACTSIRACGNLGSQPLSFQIRQPLYIPGCECKTAAPLIVKQPCSPPVVSVVVTYDKKTANTPAKN